MEYRKKSPNGEAAVRFMNACVFFDGSEIQEELINVGAPEVEDRVYHECVSSPMGGREILKLLTDFSLFAPVKARCTSTHRLVQEVVRESLDPESKTEGFLDAVRMLSYAFFHCISPSDFVIKEKRMGQGENTPDICFASSPSEFYMWSQFCIHGHYLRRQMEELLEAVDSDLVWFPEVANILYECAVHLSGNHNQEEAKRNLNLAYRILDWIPLEVYETLSGNVSNQTIFPLAIPLPKPFRHAIQQGCMPSFPAFESLADKNGSDGGSLGSLGSGASETDDHSCKSSFLTFKASDFAPGPSVVASEAPRATDVAPKARIVAPTVSELPPEAGDISFMETAGLNKEICSEIPNAIVLYLTKLISSQYLPTEEDLLNLQKNIFTCDDEVQLRKAIFSNEAIKILVLRSKTYILNFETVAQPWNNCILIGARNYCSVQTTIFAC